MECELGIAALSNNQPHLVRDLKVTDLLDTVASAAPLPGSGSVIALTTALAASIVTSVARRSTAEWDDAQRVLANADGLRRQATHLVTANAAAFSDAIDAIGSAAGSEQPGPEFDKTLHTAASSPMRIGAIAAAVAELADACAINGLQFARADAIVAHQLAEACAAAAASLVDTNQVITEDHPTSAQAHDHADRAKG